MDEERWKTIMKKRVCCELLMSTHPPQLFDINSCNLLVNLTLIFLVARIWKFSLNFNLCHSRLATIVLFLGKEAFSSVYNGHVGSENRSLKCWFEFVGIIMIHQWCLPYSSRLLIELIWIHVIYHSIEAIYIYSLCLCSTRPITIRMPLCLGHFGFPSSGKRRWRSKLAPWRRWNSWTNEARMAFVARTKQTMDSGIQLIHWMSSTIDLLWCNLQ